MHYSIMKVTMIHFIFHTVLLVRSLSAKYRPDRDRRDKSVKFGTELP